MPSEWKQSELGSLFQVKNEKSKLVRSSDYLASGEIPVVDQSSQFIAGYIEDSHRAFAGQLPVVVFGDHTRETKFVDFPFAAGADGTQILAPRSGIDEKYLYYLVLSASSLIGNFGYDRHLKHLRRHCVVFPEDADEQASIARILEAIDEQIGRTDTLIAKYQQIKAGLMHDLLTRGVDAQGRLRPPREEAPELYKLSPLGWIPKEWEVTVVQHCGSVQLGRQRSPDQLSGRWSFPYLRVANVFDGHIDYSDVLEMDFTPSEREVFSVRQGDILLNEGQSLELVGRSALFDGPDGSYCFQNTLVRFRVLEDNNPRFFASLFKWWLDCGLFMRIAKQTTSVAHLGADRFARMACPLIRADEQHRISDRLDEASALIRAEEGRRDKLVATKQGLMSDLLSGRVRVPA